MKYSKLLILAVVLCAQVALADFGEGRRSINGTGEVLRQGKYQLGVGDGYYGYTENLTIGFPTGNVVTDRGKFELRRKYKVWETYRMTPSLAVGPTPKFGIAGWVGFGSPVAKPYAQLGLDLGRNLGSQGEHSFNFGVDLKFIKRLSSSKMIRSRRLVGLRFEYDFYHRGNLAYAGVFRKLPYLGYTWSWETVHAGLITSPFSKFIPLPYIYWRF